MRPVIALIGRPNVGKSTLFNQLTRSRDALVADQPGLTRDRKYGTGKHDNKSFILIDTGGLSGDEEGIDGLMAGQARLATEEANIIFFMVDARDGLTPGDQNIASYLRQLGKTCVLVVNKVDTVNTDFIQGEFYKLGLGDPCMISAAHGRGIRGLMEEVLADVAVDDSEADTQEGIKIAIVGRPNVGKSTLVNRMLGEERVLAFDQPGTTRDSIYIPFERDEQKYILIDTAGIRRRRNISEAIEKFSIVKALQAVQDAHVVIMVLDARLEISNQDLSLLGYILEEGRALVVAINKWDGLDREKRETIKSELDRKLPFLDFASKHFISALHGTGVGDLFDLVQDAYESAYRELPTPELTRVLEKAVEAHQPPLIKGRRVKLRYAHQGGRNPPVIVIHGNQTELLPEAYRRYLVNTFRQAFRLHGTPVRIQLKTGKNPYQGRKNKLTPRQVKQRRRLMKHVKK